MRMCTSRAPAWRSMATSFRLVVPRTIESSTTTTRWPASTSRSAFSLTLTPKCRIELEGSERPPDVVVADEAHLVGQPRLLGVADRGRHARIGDGDHDVGRDRALARELAAERLAHLVHVAPEDPAVGACAVDGLEDAGLRLLPGVPGDGGR